MYVFRWVHAMCQGLTTEDEVETAADEGFDCSLCRTHSRGSFGENCFGNICEWRLLIGCGTCVCLTGLMCVCFREVRQSGVTFHGSDRLPGQRTWSVRQHADCC